MRYLRLGTVLALVIMTVLSCWTLGKQLLADDVAPVFHDPGEQLHISVKDEEAALLQGLTATDDQDGDLTHKIVIERISRFTEVGVVDVSFVVFDKANNMARHHRTVYYDDYTPPEVVLLKPLVYNEGETISVMDRLKLIDCLEGDITHKLKLEHSNVNDSQPGMYEVTLRAVTDHGTDFSVKVPLNVKKYEALAPKITLKQYIVRIKAGQEIHPEDYVTDLRDCNDYPIDFKLVFAYPQVDTTKPGSGQIRYEVSDGLGRKGYSYLTVIVE